jgi:anaerobic magnesium-protoporphyrin IX monomethyl ester cyclase
MADKKTVNVALVNPPRPAGAYVHYQTPLIGLAYMASFLEENGFQVTVIDCPPLNHSLEDLSKEIARIRPDIVGITSVTVTFSSAAQAACAIKKAHENALIVLGGPHVSVLGDQVLTEHPDVDVIIRGEGEQTLLELTRFVSESKLEDIEKIAGITFRKNGKIVHTVDRPFIQNIDELPFPNYSQFPLDRYRLYGKLILPVISSRGCPFQCSFCLAPRMAGRGCRARSPKNVVDEIEHIKKTYKPDAFTFHDETFTYDKNRVVKICQEIKQRKIGLPWDCSTRVDQISRELLVEMRSANCQLVSFGVESGSQEILNAMDKKTTVEQNAQAIKWAKSVGLLVTVSMIVGYPGETEETLRQTVEFLKKTKPDDVHLSLATPYPGIKLTRVMKEAGWNVSEDWSHCDMQTSVFENPSLSVDLKELRRTFYNEFYSIPYILRNWLRGTFYSRIMARAALNQFLWRNRLPMRILGVFRKQPVSQGKSTSRE